MRPKVLTANRQVARGDSRWSRLLRFDAFAPEMVIDRRSDCVMIKGQGDPILKPYRLRPYIGHYVRIETASSIFKGTLTDVVRRAFRIIDVTIECQNFAEMTIDTSSVLSITFIRCPHKIELVVGIGLSFDLQKVGVKVFEKLRERLACWLHCRLFVQRLKSSARIIRATTNGPATVQESFGAKFACGVLPRRLFG